MFLEKKVEHSIKSKQTFSFSNVLYKNSYNFGWWRHSRGVLSRGHRAYVVNSKSFCELLSLYYYKISFLTTSYGSKYMEIDDF